MRSASNKAVAKHRVEISHVWTIKLNMKKIQKLTYLSNFSQVVSLKFTVHDIKHKKVSLDKSF